MFVQAIDNKTNKVLETVKTNDWAKMYTKYIDGFRKKYTDATIEVFYGEPKGKPTTTCKTFH